DHKDLDLPERLVLLGLGADTGETAFLQYPDRADVRRRHLRVERSDGELLDELGQRPGRKAAAPELPAEPVADQALALPLPAADVAGHLAVGDDRLHDELVVVHDPVPVLEERLALPGRERGHLHGLGITLLLEEDRKVVLDHVTQHCHGQPRDSPRPGPVPRRIRYGVVPTAAESCSGCGTTRMYGFGESHSPKISFASSSETEPAMITSSPCRQFTGVATLWFAVSWSESITRSTSSKLRPVVIGYTRMSLTFLSGPT